MVNHTTNLTISNSTDGNSKVWSIGWNSFTLLHLILLALGLVIATVRIYFTWLTAHLQKKILESLQNRYVV
jgi:hypothetical protein